VCLSSRAGRGWEQRLRLWRSDPRERTGSDCHEDNLRGREARDHYRREVLTPQAHRQQDAAFASATGGMSHGFSL